MTALEKELLYRDISESLLNDRYEQEDMAKYYSDEPDSYSNDDDREI